MRKPRLDLTTKMSAAGVVEKRPEVRPPAPKHYPFWLGGVAASIAVCFTHPLDLTKLRMQNSPGKTTTLGLLRDTLKTEGMRGLYIGLSASVLRQMTYSLTRYVARLTQICGLRENQGVHALRAERQGLGMDDD